jgi:DNA-binding ferritin-like protein (Dps family)
LSVTQKHNRRTAAELNVIQIHTKNLEHNEMERFTAAVHQAISNKNWYAALYLSVTLPDICARLESENGKTNQNKYVLWYNTYLLSKYQYKHPDKLEPQVFLSGNDCYALRCSMLHEGTSELTTQRAREVVDRFHFTAEVGAHCNMFNSVLQIDVATFCNDMCSSVSEWVKYFQNNHNDKLDRLEELVTINIGTHSLTTKGAINTRHV